MIQKEEQDERRETRDSFPMSSPNECNLRDTQNRAVQVNYFMKLSFGSFKR